jgi:hypothetical protein
MKCLLIAVVLFLVAMFSLGAAAKGDAGTDEDRLRLQIVLLRGQLAEALKKAALCEAQGSQAGQQMQAAQTEGQALIKALDARGLMVDQNNQIVAKPAK